MMGHLRQLFPMCLLCLLLATRLKNSRHCSLCFAEKRSRLRSLSRSSRRRWTKSVRTSSRTTSTKLSCKVRSENLYRITFEIIVLSDTEMEEEMRVCLEKESQRRK